MSASKPAPWILPVIVGSQFAGTSLWFAGNAVLPDLQRDWGLDPSAVGAVTSAVQLGFIVGTLLFALLNLADRVPARAVFLACALLGSAANVLVMMGPESLASLLTLRFAVGFFLAGIYPVGMKIAASWYGKGLGRAMGLLVGALVLGTAFPHLLRAGGTSFPWQGVLAGVSALASLGGLALFFLVGDGPHLPSRSPFDPRALGRIFSEPRFRAAAFGYFGHMWELYTFWAFVPVMVALAAGETTVDVPMWSFTIIAVGVVGCVVGGALSQRFGSARVAAVQVALSGALCLLSPLVFSLPFAAVMGVLMVWGVVVIGDSPQFSALTAHAAPKALVGTALTITTSIGFFLTIPSIQLVSWLVEVADPRWAFLVLAPGPALALWALRPLVRERA